MKRRGRHASRPEGAIPAALLVLIVVATLASVARAGHGIGIAAGGRPRPTPELGLGGSVVSHATPANPAFPGLRTFRGNATRTYYGEGPVPKDPVIRWRYPTKGKMCAFSAEGRDPTDTKEWCGTGWTGQPNVVVGSDGVQVREGAYDDRYHFLDAGNGTRVIPDLVTGDLAKGSATSDPDGYPLYYAGSRDNVFRVVALDRPKPKVWPLIYANTSVPRPLWNDDWDGAALVVGDYLLEGGENSWFYVIRLNRGYNDDHLVTVAPLFVARFPGFDDKLLAAIGDEDVSIEDSVAFRDGVVYFANSGGLVQGWDISDVLSGGTDFHRVFRFWTGDDTDATIAIDDDGFLYVASELQRFDDRARDVGQLMKLDPTDPRDPLVWSIDAPEIGFEGAGGSWSTPALAGDYVYFATASGRVLEVERKSGAVVWEVQVGAPSIASPVVVDGVLLLGDCSGRLNAFDLSDPATAPPLSWSLDLGDCIESTPAVWHGWLYVGTREGYLYGIADRGAPAPSAT